MASVWAIKNAITIQETIDRLISFHANKKVITYSVGIKYKLYNNYFTRQTEDSLTTIKYQINMRYLFSLPEAQQQTKNLGRQFHFHRLSICATNPYRIIFGNNV